MSHDQTTPNRGIPGLFIAIVFCLLSLYLATYSGRIVSSDSLLVVDAASSIVHFGDTLRDESLWQNAPRNIDLTDPLPLGAYDPAEPLIAYAAALTYSLGRWVPSLGFIHATWLLNLLTVSLSAGVLFALVCRLGYHRTVAITSALLFGSGTLVWAYSKTLFRDPLVMLLLLLAILFLDHWRSAYRQVGWFGMAVLMLVAAFYTKNSALAVLPALILWSLPDVVWRYLPARLLDLVLAIVLGSLIIFAFLPAGFDWLGAVTGFYTRNAQSALHTYLFSIGGSVWGTSPILLAGWVGAWQLRCQRNYRLLFMTLILLTGYAVGHALFTGVHWFGGLSLPPRFLIPVLPVLMLLVLPVIDAVRKKPFTTGGLLLAMLTLFSVAMQSVFALSFIESYNTYLPAEAGGLVEWLPALNHPQYLRWWVLPQSWSSLGWDVAWVRIQSEYLILGFLLLSALAITALIVRDNRRVWLNGLVSIALMFGGWLAFRQLYRQDRLYWADKPVLFEVLDILEREAQPIEPLFLAGSADVTYERFILNYNDLVSVRPIVIGFQPGERTSSADTPTVQSAFNPDRISVTMLRYVDQIIAGHDRFWWLAHNSSFTEWANRPEERFFTSNYYLLNAYNTDDPTVRLLEFSAIGAPGRDSFRLPDQLTDLRFGDHITLNGYTLPMDTDYRAGDVVPITFYWQTDTIIAEDYTVSWFLVHEQGQYPPIQGVDSPPDAGFAPTFNWQAGSLIPDNRAIALPADAPAGTYQVWVRLYQTGSGGAQQLAVSGGASVDASTALLPISIEVLPGN
ncbi:MAG: hypothetical protein ACFE0Q_06335 [Anaerolineae bacterium]